MFGLEVNDAAVVEQKQILDQLLSTNPKTQKALQQLIHQVILEARAQVVSSIQFQNADPHQSRRAVRSTVYKKILGGNINILNSRKAHGTQAYQYQHKLREGQRGGNRVKPTLRTIQIQTYAPQDRGFILRWINSGADDRHINFSPDIRRKVDRWNHNPNTGNRGTITGKSFFRDYGQRALERAAEHLGTLIDAELEKILNKQK